MPDEHYRELLKQHLAYRTPIEFASEYVNGLSDKDFDELISAPWPVIHICYSIWISDHKPNWRPANVQTR